MWVTKQFLVPIDLFFLYNERQWGPFLYVQQKKEPHKGLEQVNIEYMTFYFYLFLDLYLFNAECKYENHVKYSPNYFQFTVFILQ